MADVPRGSSRTKTALLTGLARTQKARIGPGAEVSGALAKVKRDRRTRDPRTGLSAIRPWRNDRVLKPTTGNLVLSLLNERVDNGVAVKRQH